VCKDLLVISSWKQLQVFALPKDIARGDLGTPWELVHLRTLGDVAPMDFEFSNASGYMAFTDGCGEAMPSHLLLVTDGGKGEGRQAVHVVDVVHGTHVGYVAAPGTITHPRGVATRKSLAAGSCCGERGHNDVVRVFDGRDATWTPVRTIAALANGLRFTADGLGLVVAEIYNRCLRIFRVEAEDCSADGGTFTFGYPLDVEECDIRDDDDGDRAGWVVCDHEGLVAVAGDTTGVGAVVRRRKFDLEWCCSALALVPGLGLVVRHRTGVQFLATPDAVAMAAMSFCKVAWMGAVCRAIFRFS
jgi:hypothetical protein